MARIRVTKSFTFEMAHALWNYDGPCKNIHGHSYKLFVTIQGRASENTESTKLGMVMDFADLKKIVKTHIVDIFDHSVIISSRASRPDIQRVEQMFEKFYVVDYQPTCENLVLFIVETIQKMLTPGLELHSVKLYETATSFAEWYAEDNR